MNVKLSVTASELAAEDLQAITRELSMVLNRETDVQSSEHDAPVEPGQRGAPIEFGTLALALVSSGTAVAMFEVLKSFFDRRSSLEMEFQRKDGNSLRIKAENMNPEHIDRTMDRATQFFGELDE